MTRRYQPGDVVRFCDPALPEMFGREGIVVRRFRDLPTGVRLSLDLIDVWFGDELINIGAHAVELVKAVDPQLTLTLTREED